MADEVMQSNTSVTNYKSMPKFQDGVCIERISEDDTSLLVKAKHYGNHRKSLLYGGFLESTCTYDRWTTTAVGLKSYIGTPMDEHKKSGNVSEVEVESNLDAQRW